jgi:hypothetical protein
VVFGVIVVMWAVVLIPMWLRRHDETEETRSVDRFSQAMHTLSRRETASKEKKYVVMPTRVSRSRDHEVHVSGASADGRRTPKRRPVAMPATAAERRRRTFVGLLAVTVLTVMLVVLMGGILLLSLNLLVDAALVAFVLHLRSRARHAALIRPARRSTAPIARRYEDEYEYDDDAQYDDAARYADYEDDDDFEPVPVKVARAAQPVFDQTELNEAQVEFPPVAVAAGGVYDQDVPIDVERQIERRVQAPAARRGAIAEFVFDQAEDFEPVVAKSSRYDVHGRDLEIDIPLDEPTPQPARATASGVGGRPWEPVPVPKPIYASKPPAPARRARAPIFEPLLPPVDSPEELDPVEDLEEILDRRWAVND